MTDKDSNKMSFEDLLLLGCFIKDRRHFCSVVSPKFAWPKAGHREDK